MYIQDNQITSSDGEIGGLARIYDLDSQMALLHTEEELCPTDDEIEDEEPETPPRFNVIYDSDSDSDYEP